VQILWWLAPPVAATVLAMVWVSWLGREGRGVVDPEVAARRLDRAMNRPNRVTPRTAPSRAPRPGERSSGIAVRSSSRRVPEPARAEESVPDVEAESTRRAS
jgi:hypothetical protein